MKKAVIAVITVLLMLSAALAHATDSDTGENPEIQYNSTSAPDLNAKAAALTSPVNIYEYLRNNADYALYHGSRSGSINSFLGLRGNDVDLASTLIAMYRSRGYHARYAVGTVQVAASQAMNWLGVKNLDLAVAIMKDQGIQGVTLAADRSYVQFEHVWVEAQLPYGNYRGSGADAASGTCTASTICHWVALDPSFKQKQYNDQGIDPYSSLQFDYTSFYNAIKNSDSTRMNKNPLEIYEEQILSYLQTNYPGKTLEDVAYTGDIIVQENLILPASLPYAVIGAPRRYNSATDHDAAVPATEPKKWKKSLSIQFNMTVYPSGGGTINFSCGGGTALLADLATKRLTLTTEINGGIPNVVVRLDGVEIARPLAGNGTISGYTPAFGDPFSLTVTMDGTPAATSGGTDEIISATYPGIVGGYYLLATGGETSNWSQVHRAAQQLLTKDQQYKIVFNPAETGCQIGGINCTPYVDANGNGWDATDPKLLDNKPALDDLTGGLLQVAAMQYYTKLRDGMARSDALNHVKSPIAGFLGVVSSTHEVEYVDGTAFSVLPGGLLIDMKGITLSGAWRVDQPATYSNTQFEFIGHITSSLEHEIWQELTGYDAVSTVRGIQMALAGGASLLNPKKNATTDTLPGLYASFGFNGSVPSGFTYTPLTIFSTKPATWTNTAQGSAFDILKSVVTTSTAQNLLPTAEYVYSTTSGLYGWASCVDNQENQLNSYYSQYGNISVSGTQCDGTAFSGPILTVLSQIQSRYLAVIIPSYIGQSFFDFFDINKGFAPANYVYRAYPPATSAYTSSFVTSLRNDLYLRDITQYWVEYLLPSTQTTGSTYRFMVDIRKAYETSSSKITSLSFEIQNTSLSAGGGYVDGSQPLKAAQAIVGTSVITPTFNNAVFTDKNTIAQTNNDTVKTPSTADPVSTVTGNNYHDETDFTIKGRGLNIAFTRTYNSAPSSTSQNIPLGYGWTHSYNMKLKSNDYGVCPNCSSTTKPENVNNKTSSITYTDERGGEHNFLVNETSPYAVTPPTGEFDTLAMDSPSSGYYTLTFRNGVKYVFQGTNLKTAPNNTAKLTQIADPYGNQLNFTYTGSNLTGIADNLGISGRTGLVLSYYPSSTQLKDITDWSGRKWSYTYDTYGNLQSVTNPIPKTIQYTYSPVGGHNLALVTLPESRGGTQVTTAFKYYQNGKTFNYSNSLGHTETMDYDLYRKSTRVTDPRGFIREYEYDQNGLMTKLTEPDNGIHQFNNTSDLLRYKKTDALGYNTTYSYHADRTLPTDPATYTSNTGGNVTLEQDTMNYTLQYDYNLNLYDQITRSQDKNGNQRYMAYYTASNPATGAVAGKLQSVTLASLNGTANVLLQTYTYNPDGTVKQMVEQIDPAIPSRKRITDYIWENGKGLNLGSITVSGSGQSSQTTYTYDALGRKKTATLRRCTSLANPSPIYLTTTWEYDALDRVSQVTDNLGSYIKTVYDGNGKVNTITGYYKKLDGTFDARIISTRQYDAADRLISDTDIYNNVTQYAYDESGNLIQITDPNGHITRYEYDAMNRRTTVIDANGYKSQTVYDLAGRPVQAINPLGKTVKTDYDKLGRPVKITDALLYETTFEYDANGNMIKMIDANANAGLQPKHPYYLATVYKEYDELNRVKREVSPIDDTTGGTRYTYDLLGNITSITDAENHTTYFDYDDMGRLVKVRDPLVETPTDKVVTFYYDEAGNVLNMAKRSGAFSVYTYDKLNRLENAQHVSSVGTITETTIYNIYGNKESVYNGDVTYTYAYDLKNRPYQKTDSRVNKFLYYTYNKAGNIATKTNYDGSTTEYRYDSANKLVSERNRDFLEVSYQYDGAGRLLNRILSNGAQTSYTWDDGNRLATMSNTSANGTVVNSTTYVRDRLGNITSQTDASGTTAFVYDALYRLTSADYPGTTNDQSFTYDKVGNRKTITKGGATLAYVVDVDNRLKEIHQSTPTGALLNSFVYDDDGNLSSKKNSSGTVIQSLTFDAKGRANTITTSGVSQVTQCTYDPYDYRIYKYDSHGNQTNLLEGEHLEGIMSGLNWQAKFMRGAVIDEIVNGFEYNTSGVWTNYTFHHDNLQSVLGLSGHEGSVLQTIQYGPFGEKIATTGATNNNYLHFTGREEDPDSGLYYYRARMYDPTIGRFITEDPIGFAAGPNFYTMAQNNPINANDPYGNIAFFDNAVGGLVNVGIGYGISKLTGHNYGWGQAALDFGIGFVTNGLSALNAARKLNQISELSTVAKGALGRSLAEEQIARSGRSILAEEVTVATPVARPRVDFIVKNGVGELQGVEAKLGPNASLSPAQEAGYDYINSGGTGELVGSVASRNGIANQTISEVETMRYYQNGFTPSLSDTLPMALGLDLGYQGFSASSANSAMGGFVIYPNKPNTNMMRSVYRK